MNHHHPSSFSVLITVMLSVLLKQKLIFNSLLLTTVSGWLTCIDLENALVMNVTHFLSLAKLSLIFDFSLWCSYENLVSSAFKSSLSNQVFMYYKTSVVMRYMIGTSYTLFLPS